MVHFKPLLPHETDISACHLRKGFLNGKVQSPESHIFMLHDDFSPILLLSLRGFMQSKYVIISL